MYYSLEVTCTTLITILTLLHLGEVAAGERWLEKMYLQDFKEKEKFYAPGH